jgi:hypothetical protein
MSLFKFPFDTITVDGIKKPDPFDDVANLFLRLNGVAVCARKFNGAWVDRADEIRPLLR